LISHLFLIAKTNFPKTIVESYIPQGERINLTYYSAPISVMQEIHKFTLLTV